VILVEQEQLTIQEHLTSPPVVEQEQLTIQEHLTSTSVFSEHLDTLASGAGTAYHSGAPDFNPCF